MFNSQSKDKNYDEADILLVDSSQYENAHSEEDREILTKNLTLSKCVTEPDSGLSDDIQKVVEILGQDKFAKLELPESHFWDESRQ